MAIKEVKAFKVDGKLYETEEQAQSAQDNEHIADGLHNLLSQNENVPVEEFKRELRENTAFRNAIARYMISIDSDAPPIPKTRVRKNLGFKKVP